MPSDAVLYQAAALCLTRPDDGLLARLPLLREAAPQVREFADHAAVTPAAELRAQWERVFGPRPGLYLSRWAGADGAADDGSLARYARAYRAHGLEFAGDEPPDFLPAVLELAARTGETGLLTDHRAGLEGLRARLTALGTPYASVLDAVCAALPLPRPTPPPSRRPPP
ncbi:MULTISPECIES: nitrate reductase molybdenum cofactor assembly chaperone [Streptomyces]|jgi:nitrate reductase molybdenum cofactor assembly chaperone NarJ/NarW|uniref:Molecular chaperone TorD family protein n=1 Tax=Streptomyces doudnae TaxID=3075536 RepID=A0ABD5EN31_9ACTN|nr:MULTISPECIES: molecular chaperone TorD family protein [unclassified Streptomyces]MDT0436088.1 molecular chaperone TorD family protein [Streptomyces sp. DSM 41981]MYQ67943.1 nitrate reductase [Streptomyces sp. SID4950]SCE41593.1 respiratory nitrate reductase chaperone NarJ [Streptomyces sp. SolWspMP-5a-2]